MKEKIKVFPLLLSSFPSSSHFSISVFLTHPLLLLSLSLLPFDRNMTSLLDFVVFWREISKKEYLPRP